MSSRRCAAAAGAGVVLMTLGVLAAPGAGAQAGGDVRVEDNRFTPPERPADVGETVTWVWVGASVHTVTARDGSFDSGEKTQGGRFAHTFAAAGTVAYYCRIHGDSMTGVVTVREASPTAAPPASPTRPRPSPTTAKPTPTASPTAAPSAATSPAPLPSPTTGAPSSSAVPSAPPRPTPVATPAPPPTPVLSPTAAPSASAGPSRTAAPLVSLDDPLPKDRSGLAIAIGLLVAAAGLGTAGLLLLRRPRPISAGPDLDATTQLPPGPYGD